MTYYVRVVQSAAHRGYEIWKITDDEAIRLGSQGGGLWHYRRALDETIWDAIRRHAAWAQPDGSLPIYKLKLAPRQYFPRIARNIIPDTQNSAIGRGWQPSQENNETAIAGAKVQLSTLVRQLERICETVHPEEPNLDSYGYDIRNLLILACTEVESHWRAVLKANGLSKVRWTTRDYVSLKEAMKLNKYSISFPDYPWLKRIAPFERWDEESPTQTLPWYDAYNAAKHDRESELKSATLRFAFDAVAACIVMIVAQFGEVFGFDLNTSRHPRTFFWLRGGPIWDLTDCYSEAFEAGNGEWVPVNYPFSGDARLPQSGE